MSVEIEPAELGFRRPFTVEVSQILKIRNPNPNPVAFKVKTTAPKQYCVRPNSGRIEPDHEVEVTVLLQAMRQDPPLDAKCRDKFLVQSVNITADKEFVNVQQIWESIEKSAVQEQKLRVVFLPSDGSVPSVTSTPVRAPLSNGVDSTPEAQTYSPYDERSAPSTAQQHPRSPDQFTTDSKDDAKSEHGAATSVVSAASGRSPNESVVEDLKAKLAEAESMIATLKQEGGVRLRKGASAVSEKVEEKAPQIHHAVQKGTEGVPIQIAAALCLLSFLLAYFLF